MKDFFKYPHLLFFIIAVVDLFVALVNYHSSIMVKDYIKIEGEVCNVETEQVLWHRQYVTRYNYDIVWYDEGEEYTKHLEEQADSVEEGTRMIWVHPDNKDAVLHNSVQIGKDVPIYILIGLASGAIGFVICKYRQETRRESKAERIERLEDTKLYSVMAMILATIGEIFFGVMCYQDYKRGEYITPVIYDVFLVIGVIGMIAFLQYKRAAKQLKKLGSSEQTWYSN